MTDTYIESIEAFAGVDLTDPAWTVAPNRSPEGTNMTRDVPGRVRKRMGYETVHDFGENINGIYAYGDHMLVHAGHRLYKYAAGIATVLVSNLAADVSFGLAFGRYLLILDGTSYRVYDGTSLTTAAANATIPTVSISTPPTGGGTDYQAVNMLTPSRKQAFLGTANDTVYQLSARDIDPTPVTAAMGSGTDEAGRHTFAVSVYDDYRRRGSLRRSRRRRQKSGADTRRTVVRA